MKRISILLLFVTLALHAVDGDTLVLKNSLVQRVLKKDGAVWRTVRFARADGSDALDVQSDEFHILPMGSEKGWTISDYVLDGPPAFKEEHSASVDFASYEFHYSRKDSNSPAPPRVTIFYGVEKNALFTKTLSFPDLAPNQALDRVQIERFSTATPASRGGRGEPVFCGPWFFGLDYPAAFNRHSSGPIGRPYDKLGNFSFINLEGRENEFEPRPGLISLAHFPGTDFAEKTAVAGIGKPGETNELAFLDYLDTIRRPVRSYIHYNNWYDGSGKNLKPENFVASVAHEFMSQMKPYGVKVDAFVPDNGWQNRNSIWQPNPHHFPDGMKSFAELGAALKKEGTSLGLWFTLNGYELNTDWGLKNGYFEAQRSPHFARFNRYYALGDPHYNAALRAQLSALIANGQLDYIKHDFNDMCDSGPHNGTLPTDRHGHEKAVDETISILKMERELNPAIFQNVTNWIWFSPWWLKHCNTLWMLSDDTGLNRKWPALSDWQMAITYRDAHLFRAWGDPATRPLVPISHLMTHGIVNASHSDGPMSDPIGDWSDYVRMYYARGVQLKEWYITPKKMDEPHWRVLGDETRWAQDHQPVLANAVFIGGNPEKGEAYGYVAWKGDSGIVTVRNPDIKTQTLTVPFDQSVWYRGPNGLKFAGENGKAVVSGESFAVTIPGWSTKTIELAPLKPNSAEIPVQPLAPLTIKRLNPGSAAFEIQIPNDPGPMSRCEVVTISRGGEIPALKLNGEPIKPALSNQGPGWKTASFDVKAFQAKSVQIEVLSPGTRIFPFASGEIEVWLLADRNAGVPIRETYEVLPPTQFKTVSKTGTLTAEQLKSAVAAKVHLDLFGSDGGKFADKKLTINGVPVLALPANKHGDNWEEFELDLPTDTVKTITLKNTLCITNPSSDKFKFRNLALAVKLQDGTWISTALNSSVHCHDKEWAHFEGEAFGADGKSNPVNVNFAE